MGWVVDSRQDEGSGMIEQTVRIAVDMTVNQGQLDAFKNVAAQLTEYSKDEPGTLGYEWFAGGDGKSFRLVETYANPDAVDAHFNGPAVQVGVPRLLAVCMVDRFEIFGDPGPTVSQTAKGMGAVIFPYFLGLAR
jgi:quinol monooxygenase YgiN